MKGWLMKFSAIWLAASLAATTAVAQPAPHPAPVVFFDIAAPQLASQAAFYRAVLGWDIDATGGFAVPAASPLHATLRVESPGGKEPLTERVVYVGVADINATLASVKAHGGGVVFPRLVVPGVVIVALFTDPAGNRMGLVELDSAGKPIVPPRKP